MAEQEDELIVPVVSENVHADAAPVETGGVRVVKRVESHDEVLQQELRKSHVEIRRIKTERVVDGPQPAQRVGNTLIIPVVSEVLRVTKEWVVTEEIHVTQLEEREKFEQTVPVRREVAEVQRFDQHGNVHLESAGAPAIAGQPTPVEEKPQVLAREAAASAGAVPVADAAPADAPERRILNQRKSILRHRKNPS